MKSISSHNYLDEELLQKIAEGCQHSFNTFCENYWEDTYTSAYKRLKDSGMAKNVVQEIFTHIWFKRETLQINNIQVYLHMAVRSRIFKQVANENLSHPFFTVLETLPSLHQQSDSNFLAREFFKAYEALVNKLPAKKQHILRIRFGKRLTN